MEYPTDNVGNVIVPEDDFEDMKERLAFLDALEAAGVDNWEGCSYAHELLREGI